MNQTPLELDAFSKKGRDLESHLESKSPEKEEYKFLKESKSSISLT
jgi:hypothetical protein